MSVNSFNNIIDKQEYIFKLLPDFGVFDIAERAIIDGNTKSNSLFFYKTTNDEITTNFRRFIVKSEKDIIIKNSKDEIITDDDKIIVSHSFTISGYKYRVIIDEQFLSDGFKVSTDGDYMIGVCF